MKKSISILVSIVFIFSVLFNASFTFAAQPVMSGFNPDKLIEDRVFKDTSTFSSAAAIQSFLQSKSSVLANTSPEFIAKLKEPSSSDLKTKLEDPHPSQNNRTAAELIYDAAKSSGLNPQVILVTLNKEQGLITARQDATADQLQRALDFSMGFGCPDASGCGELYRGFYGQLFGGVDSENNRYLGAAKSLMKSFTTPGGRGPLVNGAVAKVGDRIRLGNTLGGYEGVQAEQTVTLSNSATAALYRYTPHVFNGNYNFWRYFTTWFGGGSGNGLVKRSTKLYLIKEGKKFKILNFVAKANRWSARDADKISSRELSGYPDGGYLAPNDNTIIKVDDEYFVFIAGVRRPATEDVITQRGLSIRKAIKVSEKDAEYFVVGSALAATDPVVVPTTPPPAPTSTNSLVKGSAATVYLIENGQKTALSYEMFVSRGFSFANVATISDSELNAYPTAGGTVQASSTTTPPTTTTWFSNSKTGEFWVWLSGAKHLISPFVAKQKGMTPDVAFDETYINSLPTGKPIMPKEGTIIKGTSADVYVISGGLAQPMTYAAFVARNITTAQINILPQAEVDGYPKGSVLTQ